MSDPLLCAKCGREIVPGTIVELIGAEPDTRIWLDSEVLTVHKTCPTDEKET